MVARMAIAVRPKFDGVPGVTEAGGVVLDSADTVEFHEVELT
jgi:hypothetical protein